MGTLIAQTQSKGISMETDYKVFVVDDDKTMRLMLGSMLGKAYAVECFDSAESCLNRLTEVRPSLFLLDVGLPGMNGYDLCRDIKGLPDFAAIPVVFISGHNELDAVMTGYDAGGEDYIAKPIDIAVLQRKIENLRRIEQDRNALSGQAKDSDELATLVLANLDEYAVLIKFLRSLNECGSTQDVVEAILHSLDAFRLEGAVQIRTRNVESTFSRAGENWPLEVAVMNHIRSLDRIFEFRTRCAYNFEHISILVTNMPVADAELCGRIRDHLAIAAEAADAKLIALQSFADNITIRDEIHNVLQAVGKTVTSYSKSYDEARVRGSMYTNRILDDLLAAFAHLGMSPQQEEEILGMVKDRSNRLIDIYDIAGESQATLGSLSERLEGILVATNNNTAPKSTAAPVH
jgi:DNA-binding response OmpR family regulator